ncbi:MAG: glutamine--fructose-6-phosphate transaminase (isomerizing) [Pseudomonadota bacterium]
MCGIIGVLGEDDVVTSILDGLKRLEYRGYDSAGIATVESATIHERRAPGKLSELSNLIATQALSGRIGIGHTRWATHGAPTQDNAHPHVTEKLALVHNGIIENFAELRSMLSERGVSFRSQTDSEVIARLIDYYLTQERKAPYDAVRQTLSQLHGAFAIAVVFADDDDLMIAARQGSPLAIGVSTSETEGNAAYVGSDAYALAPFTNRIAYLEDGDLVSMRRSKIDIFDAAGALVDRSFSVSSVTNNVVGKDGHRHFMAKEIHEQPDVIAHTLSNYIDVETNSAILGKNSIDFKSLDKLLISACGTAFYAGLTAKYWFESWAKLPVEIDIASELRYRDVPYTKNGAAIFISQSGETADTLAALRNAKSNGQKICSVVNVPESSIARESDVVFPMAAGPEIGVASTKAFTCQLATLACIAVAAGRARGVLTKADEEDLIKSLLATPRLISEAIAVAPEIEKIAKSIAKARDIIYVGRGLSFPIAMEGALKLKEISYIHAEGYAAGELKHGPIALIDKETPVIVIAPPDKHFDKTVSNMHEVISREGRALFISSETAIDKVKDDLWASIPVPDIHPQLSPIVYAAPVQLLAYFTATTKGTDVDQPRNLAKSVTVE